jgi:hypothetical protein
MSTTASSGLSTPVSSRLSTPVTSPRPSSGTPSPRFQKSTTLSSRFGSAQRSSSRSGVVERITGGRFKGTTKFDRGSCGLRYPKIVKRNRSQSGVQS